MASSKREKELARQRAERQAARRAATTTRKKQRTAVLASAAAMVLVVLAAVAVGTAVTSGDDTVEPVAAATPSALAEPSAAPSAEPSADPTAEPSADPSAEPSADPSQDPAATGVSCIYTPSGTPAKTAAAPPTQDVEAELVLDVTMTTSQGQVVFEMDTAAAPCTASSLRSLASVGYFDGTPCHRLTTRGISVLQCGDPTGTGTGGPGYVFDDENLEGATYPRGTVAMANGGPGTNGSQFFLVYADSQLPAAYTPFGVITEGLEVLDRVAAAGTDDSSGVQGDGPPALPVQVERLRVTARAA